MALVINTKAIQVSCYNSSFLASWKLKKQNKTKLQFEFTQIEKKLCYNFTIHVVKHKINAYLTPWLHPLPPTLKEHPRWCHNLLTKFKPFPFLCTLIVATPLWPSVGVKPNTPKVGDLESSGAPECLVLDNKAQNTSHWGVLGLIEKVLKRRYRKWPCIGHLDIFSPSYGQKKGRESNCQFDSRPLKVWNRPLPDFWIESATWCWKDLDEGYNFGLDLVAIRLCSRELWTLKVPGLQPGQFRDNFGIPTWESREKEPFGCSPRRELQKILYGGRWWLPPSPGHGESCVSKCPWFVPTSKGVPECELSTLWFVLDVDSSLIY